MITLQERTYRGWTITVLLTIVVGTASAQIPSSLENELDNFNIEIYQALLLLKTETENDAVAKLATIKPELRARETSLLAKIDEYPEMSEEEEEAFDERQLSKPVYKNLVLLLNDNEFKKKVGSNERLQKEFDELMEIMNIGVDANEGDMKVAYDSSSGFYCSFKFPNGTFDIIASQDESGAYIDDSGMLTVEVNGLTKGNYTSLLLMIEDVSTGKHKWNSDGQIYLQSDNEDGSEIVHLQNYREEGYIIIEQINDNIVTGSFTGLFFDDNLESDKKVSVEGRFSVNMIQ
jgi:hypothetical protein